MLGAFPSTTSSRRQYCKPQRLTALSWLQQPDRIGAHLVHPPCTRGKGRMLCSWVKSVSLTSCPFSQLGAGSSPCFLTETLWCSTEEQRRRFPCTSNFRWRGGGFLWLLKGKINWEFGVLALGIRPYRKPLGTAWYSSGFLCLPDALHFCVK